ncbi:MAG TPA: MerR family transcriptional regulator [Ktedonobacteraceae bacterium]|jgi:MerR family copper efflux transcriptional regulator|nr:MerR family transcriptional regulator [Ktedonobacteraceae bacterium]
MQAYSISEERNLAKNSRSCFTIGQLARLTGVNAKAIRYYESIELLPHPERENNGYRRYSQADLNRLTLLRRLRILGVPLAMLKPLLTGASDARCTEIQQDLLALVNARLVELDQEIAELYHLRDQVSGYQHKLVSWSLDRQASFRTCRDLSCLAEAGEIRLQEK